MKILNNASERLPYFAFYPADWLTDLSLRLCSPETRGVWIDLLCHMSLSPERGFLIISGRVLDEKGIQKLSGISPKKFKKVFDELIDFGILKKDETGRFFSKRMVGDERLRQIRREVGKKGGNPKLKEIKANKERDLVSDLDNQNINQKPTVSKTKSKVNSQSQEETIIYYSGIEGLDLFEESSSNNLLIEYIARNCPNIKKLSKQLNEEQAEKILSEFDFELIRDTLDRMENYKPLLKRYSSVNLTLKNWLKTANHEQPNNSKGSGKPSFIDALRDF